jgi:hypothetical protein
MDCLDLSVLCSKRRSPIAESQKESNRNKRRVVVTTAQKVLRRKQSARLDTIPKRFCTIVKKIPFQIPTV